MNLTHAARTLEDRLRLRLEYAAQRAAHTSRARVLPTFARLYYRGVSDGYQRSLAMVAEEAQRCTR